MDARHVAMETPNNVTDTRHVAMVTQDDVTDVLRRVIPRKRDGLSLADTARQGGLLPRDPPGDSAGVGGREGRRCRDTPRDSAGVGGREGRGFRDTPRDSAGVGGREGRGSRDSERGREIQDERIARFQDFPGLHEWDLVYPGILLGGKVLARNLQQLGKLGVTHVLNAAEGQGFAQIPTNAEFYRSSGMSYLGIKANDDPRFKMAPYFPAAVDFIYNALKCGGKVYVHCYYGISRSASLVLAYLVAREGLSLPQAVTKLRQTRLIYPNEGFIRELCHFYNSLPRVRKK